MKVKASWSAVDVDGNAYCYNIRAETEAEARRLAEDELKSRGSTQYRFWVREGKLMRRDS